MGICGIFGCSNRRGFAQYSFFKTPKVVYGHGDATRLLSEERRRLWKAAVRRQAIVTEARARASVSNSIQYIVVPTSEPLPKCVFSQYLYMVGLTRERSRPVA